MPVIVLVSLAAATLVYWWGYQKPLIGIDDANIYFVYMKNLAEGRGFVWNTGGERVEGFTSLLWTLIGALFYKLSPTQFPVLLLALGFILTFLTVYNLLKFSRKLYQKQGSLLTGTDVIILTLVLAPRGYIEWNVINLMETSLWTFLLVRITLELCRFYLDGSSINITRFSVLLILLNLTRPESAAFNLLFISIFFIIFHSESGLKTALRKTAVPLMVHVVSFASLIGWRLSYFGYPFPNTYYAKVSGNKIDNIVAGLHYIFNFFFLYPHVAFLAGVLFFFGIYFFRKARSNSNHLTSNDKILAILFSVVLAGLALPVLTGGDHFTFARFYLPFLPLLYLAATDRYLWQKTVGVGIQVQPTAKVILLLAFIVTVLFSSKSTVFDFFTRHGLVNFPEFDIATKGRFAAEKMNEAFAAGNYPSIGSFATGGVGYSYKGQTIDLLGLNSTVMAHASRIKTGIRNHASFDKKAFWQLKPDVLGTAYGGEVITDTASFVLYENIPGYRNDNFLYLAYKKIFDDEDFRAVYLPALVHPKNKDYFIFGYYKKAFLDSLDSSAYGIKLLERKFNPAGPLSKK